MQKRTKIVCTLGPASQSVETLEKMARAGMNVARLNFSHGTYEEHKQLMENVRKVEKITGEPIAIMQDLQGPKIRVGEVPPEGIELVAGRQVVFCTGEANRGEVPIQYQALSKFIKSGERMLLDDGKMEVEILAVEGQKIRTRVRVGGVLTSHKGINIPESDLTGLQVLTDKDKKDARFGIEHGVDIIALSFVMRPDDILDLRFHIKQMEQELGINNKQPIKIVAKIEKQQAVDKIREIVSVTDGIMVARGDLGLEIPAEDVPLVQKNLIDTALEHAKPVIVATQMLDSMQHNPRPTRAEVSDVSNAVIDHTDAVMLSNETATGEYPVVVVETMSRIIKETELSHYDDLLYREPKNKYHKIDDTISGLSRVMAEKIQAKLILAASLSGETGRLISRYRPEFPIIVATSTDRVKRQLNLSWGVQPFILVPCRTIEELVERSVIHLKKDKLVRTGDAIIVVAGEPVGHAGHVNLLEVREVK